MSTAISHHPEPETLLSYASGGLAEPLSAVVAAHVAVCARCRREVQDLEMLGTALLLAERPSPARRSVGLPQPRLPAYAELAMSKGKGSENRLIPAPIAMAYGFTSDDIPWKRLGPGIWHHRLPLSEGAAGDLRLLKIAAGRTMPDHGHGGAELTLVLDGAFSDQTGHYTRGDLQDVDEGIEHTPVSDAVHGCICLIASETQARFKGMLSRLLQPLTGM